jgi:predicted lipoprotein with Yx(FWY)xxD motif
MNKSTILLRLLVIPALVAMTACTAIGQAIGLAKPQATPLVPVTGGKPSVTVNDQQSDGTSVIVADVYSAGPGWMVIHKQANGNIGDPIGEAQLAAGDNKNVVVKIDSTQVTPVLYAMLHVDAGTVGKYEFPGPDIPVTLNDQMVSPPFNVSLPGASANGTPAAMPDATQTAAAGSMGMTTPAAGASNPLVKVSDQPLTGSTLLVDEVVSNGPGWIVIYSTDSYGQPSQPIGHAAVHDGDNQMVSVQVDPAQAQGTLIAQLQVDAGTVGTFEYPGADAPVMVGVQMISGTFKVTTGQSAAASPTPGASGPNALQPSITVADQAIQNGTVTVGQIVSNGNWWLVIHRQNPDGSMGEYIGETLIKNGINTNVSVNINTGLATPVLYAMLHEDHGIIGVLEFPGADVPVMVNNQMVAPKFNVTGLSQDITINIKKASTSVSYLVDGAGNSLYISLQDNPGKSNCDPTCLTAWKPLLAGGRVIAGTGVTQANLGVILLPSGAHQVTYLGAPLYSYYNDVNPGDTKGQGLNGVWFLVTP